MMPDKIDVALTATDIRTLIQFLDISVKAQGLAVAEEAVRLASLLSLHITPKAASPGTSNVET